MTQRLEPDARVPYNRYFEGSPVYPPRFKQDWNRSYVMEPAGPPKGVVVLLHGLTDSPYSLRHVARRYVDRGFVAIGIRMPGHGTVPAGLSEVRWRDWSAATRLAVREARRRVPAPAPLHLAGFSNGGALAVKYALDAIEDPKLPRADRLTLFTPMIGITRFARYAGLAGLPAVLPPFASAAWLSNVPEFNPFKYNSFPVNGARQSYLLTDALQRQIQQLARSGQLETIPPVLTFQSVIDFTVSTPAILTALYAFLPDNGSEIVLFDVNRTVKFGPAAASVGLCCAGSADTDHTAGISLHRDRQRRRRHRRDHRAQHCARPVDRRGQAARVALSARHLLAVAPGHPDPARRPALRNAPRSEDAPGVRTEPRRARCAGERGALIVDQDFLTRLPSNPFFPYLLARVEEGIDRPSTASGRRLVAPSTAGVPVRLEALLSTFRPDDADAQPFAGP